MEIEYDLTPEDLTAFQRYHRRNAPHRLQLQMGLAKVFVLAVFGVSVLVTTLFYMLAGNNMAQGYLLVVPYVGLGAALAVLGMVVYYRLTAGQMLRRVLQQGRNSEKLLGWRRVSIDAEGIRSTSDFAASTYLWHGIDKIGATLDHAFLYINTTTAVVVPCRAFADDRAFEEFVDAARRYRRIAVVGGGAWEGPIPTALPADDPGASEGSVPKEVRRSFRDPPGAR